MTSLYLSVTSYLPSFLKWAPRKKTINDLPDHCLANIFSQTLCPSGSPSYAPTFVPCFSPECREDPFLLGQVCRKWRNVTLRTSELWCSITIIHPKSHHLYRAERWMQRAGNRAIAITFRQSAHPTGPEMNASAALLTLFNSREAFWQSIEIHLNDQSPAFLQRWFKDLSRMRNCKLTQVNLSLHSSLPASEEWPEEWPEYRELVICCVWDLLQGISSITSLKWDAPVVGSACLANNINVVDIKAPISIETLRQVILSAETLQSVVIHRLSLPSHSLHIIEQTLYPRLTVLDITASPITSDISSLLRSVILPSLTFLILAQVEHDTLVHVADLIHRSRCTLDVFGIRIPNFNELQIMEWLNMDGLQQVTSLILEGPITDNILRAFHRPAQYGDQPCYFPNLKRLGLGKCVATIDNGLLLRMLGSRFWTPPYIAGPKLPGTELEFACITVQEVTAEHEAYAAMIKRTTEGSGHETRELEIIAY